MEDVLGISILIVWITIIWWFWQELKKIQEEYILMKLMNKCTDHKCWASITAYEIYRDTTIYTKKRAQKILNRL